MNTTQPPRVPVKVVFRKTAPIGGVSGLLAAGHEKDYNTSQVMAILPYQTLLDGLKGNDMVAMVSKGGERLVVHYPTIINNTQPAEPSDYQDLLDEMQNLGGYEVTVIEATNIDHLLRRADREVCDEIVSEEITIDLDIVNDDIDSKSGVDSDSFQEEWA